MVFNKRDIRTATYCNLTDGMDCGKISKKRKSGGMPRCLKRLTLT
jgi:hypothetical protein